MKGFVPNACVHFHKRINTYKKTVYKWVFLLVIMFVLVFGIYSFYGYRKICIKNAKAEAINIGNRLVSQIDERLQNLMQYYNSILSDISFQNLLDDSAFQATYSDICSKIGFKEYVSNIALVNLKTGTVLSHKGRFQLEDKIYFGGVLGNYEGSNLNEDYWIYQNNFILEGIADINDSISHVAVDIDGLSSVIHLPVDSYNTYVLLIVNIDANLWQQWISSEMNAHDEVVVADKNGEIRFATNSALTEYTTSSSGVLGKQKVNGQTYIISVLESDILEWNYFVFHKMDNAQTGMGFIFALFIFLLLFTVFSFFIMSRFIYKPVDELVKSISELKEFEPINCYNGNEFMYLKENFWKMHEGKLALEHLIDQQQEDILELFELRLIHGEVNHSIWENYLKSMKLRPWKYFTIMVANLNHEIDKIEDLLNEEVICLKILQELSSELKTKAWLPPIYNAGTIVAMFAEEEETTIVEVAKEFCDGFKNCAENIGNCQIKIGISSIHERYQEIRTAYYESINALAFSIENCGQWQDGVISTDEMLEYYFYMADNDSQKKVYDHTFEDNIRVAVKALDKQKCYEITDSFCRYLFEFRGRENEFRANIFLFQYVNAIVFSAIDLGIDINGVYSDDIRKMYTELLEAAEPEREGRLIKWKFIDPIIKERLEYLEVHAETMLDEIERMIAERNGNISVSECAEALGVHTTYIWKVLKMERNKSFSDYVEEYKLMEAKRLLMETELTVSEIAEKLNYANAQNFIRFFSKSTGVTPGKYRKIY